MNIKYYFLIILGLIVDGQLHIEDHLVDLTNKPIEVSRLIIIL